MIGGQPLFAAAEIGQPPQGVLRFVAEGSIGREFRTRLQHQHLEAGLGQGHRGHSARGAGPHHDGLHH